MLVGHLLAGAQPGYAGVRQAGAAGQLATVAPTTNNPSYPPYPPTDCFRHYQRPAPRGWNVELVWWGGRACPRIFFYGAQAEIWMYEGSAAPQSGPWSKGSPAKPAAIYGGHLTADDETADDSQRRAGAQKPAARWWEKVKVVPVERDGSWSADILVEEPGPYTFAAVNSLSREYVLIEVEVWDTQGTAEGGAGGAEAAPVAAGNVTDPGPGNDDLLRVGVPTASSALIMGAALVLLRRMRRNRQS